MPRARIRFCGTKGYIEESSSRHRMHSAQLLLFRGKRLLLDAGRDWAGRVAGLKPDWIAITHAHPDHALALANAPDVPVYVTRESYELLRHYPVRHFRIIEPWREYRPGPFRLTAYPVVHSIRCPAVGFRVRFAGTTIAYNPDVISIPDEARALRGVSVYIGDGASLTRPIIRRRGDALFGHTTVRAQLNWCMRNGIRCAYIVHCGKQLVQMSPKVLQARVNHFAGPDLRVTVASDGMEVLI